MTENRKHGQREKLRFSQLKDVVVKKEKSPHLRKKNQRQKREVGEKKHKEEE